MKDYTLKVPSSSKNILDWLSFVKESLKHTKDVSQLTVDFNDVRFMDTDNFVILACLIENFDIKNIVKDSSSNEQGMILFNILQDAYLNNEALILCVDSDLSMSSSFLNSSIGTFLDKYGLSTFRQTIKFKGSKNQYLRLSDYINKYSSLYLA